MGDSLSCSVVAEIDEVVTGERASCLLQPTTRNKAAEVDGIRNDTFLSRETALRRCQQGSQISGNTVIGRRPRRSSLSIVPIALLDDCTASLRVLRWACRSGHVVSGRRHRQPSWVNSAGDEGIPNAHRIPVDNAAAQNAEHTPRIGR